MIPGTTKEIKDNLDVIKELDEIETRISFLFTQRPMGNGFTPFNANVSFIKTFGESFSLDYIFIMK